jgi:outer membrane biosynthesis protein TonB
MHDVSANLSRMQISGPPRKMVYPDYPDKPGKVLLRAVVSSDGAVRQVRLIAGDPLLAASAKAAIRQWRYQPLLSDDRRLERETRIIVAFISDDVVSVSFPEPAPISQ